MRPGNRLPRWQRRLGGASGLLVLVTGLGWLALHYGGGGDDGLPHPAEAWVMKLHGLGAMAALFVFGALAGGHMTQGWQLARRHGHVGQRQRRLGVAVGTLAALLTASGYALYYWVPEGAREATGLAHAGAGLAMAALLWVHRARR